MKGAVQRAVEITKHIPNDRVRTRVTKNIAKLLGDLDAIAEYADSGPENEWVDRGEDHVPVVTPESLNWREKTKIESIKRTTELFPPSAVEVTVNDEQDINARGKFGYTALHAAVVDDDEVRVVELCECGADLTIRDNSGSTPYQKAINMGKDAIAAILREYMEQSKVPTSEKELVKQ